MSATDSCSTLPEKDTKQECYDYGSPVLGLQLETGIHAQAEFTVQIQIN